MQRPDESIEVVGAGPAGLAAAITLARGGVATFRLPTATVQHLFAPLSSRNFLRNTP